MHSAFSFPVGTQSERGPVNIIAESEVVCKLFLRKFEVPELSKYRQGAVDALSQVPAPGRLFGYRGITKISTAKFLQPIANVGIVSYIHKQNRE
jgi:hypothetical protein